MTLLREAGVKLANEYTQHPERSKAKIILT